MKTFNRFALAVCGAVALASAVAAQSAPTIAFDSAPNAVTLPDDVYLGEVGGVATNSRGDVFVYTRTGHPTMSMGSSRPFVHGGSRLFQFDRNGKFVREIGHGIYGFLFAAQVRVDPQDNVWVVDEYSSMVIKFDPQGRESFLLGRKPESIQNPGRAGGGGGGGEGGGRGGGAAGAGGQQDVFNRPTDVAWDAQGNIFVADGHGNARVAKFSKDGVFVKSWGQRGSAAGQFASVDSIAVDAQGNVYAADAGNQRIQVFDNSGTFKAEIKNVGNAQAICITPGSNTQVMYVSNSNPPNDLDAGGEIYKMRLDGTVVGKFGRAGKLLKEFGTVNAIDCRTENVLYVGEVGNYRVQKLTLR